MTLFDYTLKKNALARLVFSRPIRAKYSYIFHKEICRKDDQNDPDCKKYHTNTPAQVNQLNGSISKLLEMFDESFINPFNIRSPEPHLVNFSNWHDLLHQK